MGEPSIAVTAESAGLADALLDLLADAGLPARLLGPADGRTDVAGDRRTRVLVCTGRRERSEVADRWVAGGWPDAALVVFAPVRVEAPPLRRLRELELPIRPEVFVEVVRGLLAGAPP